MSAVRSGPTRLALAAVAAAAAANIGAALLLALIGTPRTELPPPPLTTMRLSPAPTEREPPPATPPTAAPAVGAAPAAAAAALPPFDVPLAALGEPALPPPTLDAFDPSAIPRLGAGGAALAGMPAPVIDEFAFDEGPQLLTAFDLERFYPRQAKMRGTIGRTRLRLAIDERGVVTDVAVIESDPPDVFDQAALDMLRSGSVRYRPATRADKPVACVVQAAIDWNLRR